jgi:hypothetical protein
MQARIVSIRWQSVAIAFSVIYALIGAGTFVWSSLNHAPEMLAPFGIIGPSVQFTFNLHLVRSDALTWDLFWSAIQTVAYAVSGWLSGATFAILFNVIIRLIGGIDTKYVILTDVESPRL